MTHVSVSGPRIMLVPGGFTGAWMWADEGRRQGFAAAAGNASQRGDSRQRRPTAPAPFAVELSSSRYGEDA